MQYSWRLGTPIGGVAQVSAVSHADIAGCALSMTLSCSARRSACRSAASPLIYAASAGRLARNDLAADAHHGLGCQSMHYS